MKSLKFYLVVVGLWQCATVFCQTNHQDFPVLKGPYIGQTPPGNQSKVFAPGFVSTEFGELNSVFTRDGKEFYFSRRGVPGQQSTIMVSRMENEIWTKPEPVGFSTSYSDIDLSLTPDGQSMVFCSNRIHQKGDGVKTDHDFWISKREGTKWAEPQLFAKEALSEFEDYFPIVTNSGNLFFNSQRGGRGTNDIYCSRYIDGKYSAAEKLQEPINTQYREFDAFVNPDEKMILFSSEKPGGFGGADIYVSFKRPDGSWTEPKNLGNDINSAQSEYGATLSPDGKYLFYTSGRNGSEDIFWVSAEFIETLRPVEDVFQVMEIVTGQNYASLWPNFRTSEIPVLVFDSINTWLFHSKVMPEGFSEVREHPKVYRFPGQHPLVRGNSIVRMGDTWVATSIFSRHAQRTGERYSAKDLAGIIIHEQFHIFSKSRHTKWQDRKKQEIEQFHAMPGYSIEINASNNPLTIRIFDPLEIEILDDHSVYHRLIFSAGNEAGSLWIMNQPCMTRFDNSLRVTGVSINGLKEKPEILDKEKKIKLTEGRTTIGLKYSQISIKGSLYVIDL